MRDGSGSMGVEEVDNTPRSHNRILAMMALLGLAGSIATAVFVSVRFGAGVLLGTAIAFANYYWLKHSLRKVFENAQEGEKPRVSALRYIGRYFALGNTIAVIFLTDVVPVIAVLFGAAAFGFAVVADGLIQIFSGFSNRKEV